jgi:hypothetical protein
MEILGSNRYVDLTKQKGSWYQLSVINMWDWSTPTVCYGYVGKTLISYALHFNTPKTENSWDSKVVTEITEEMKDELTKMGYRVK